MCHYKPDGAPTKKIPCSNCFVSCPFLDKRNIHTHFNFHLHILYAFILRGVTMENVCNAAISIYQPSFPCFIPVIANTSGYAEPYNGTSRNKKMWLRKILLKLLKNIFSFSILYRCHFLLMSASKFCP